MKLQFELTGAAIPKQLTFGISPFELSLRRLDGHGQLLSM